MEFLRMGRRRFATASVKAVIEDADGSVLLYSLQGTCEVLTGDDAAAALEWADANTVPTPKTDAARAARLKEKADRVAEEAAALAKAEAVRASVETKAEAPKGKPPVRTA